MGLDKVPYPEKPNVSDLKEGLSSLPKGFFLPYFVDPNGALYTVTHDYPNDLRMYARYQDVDHGLYISVQMDAEKDTKPENLAQKLIDTLYGYVYADIKKINGDDKDDGSDSAIYGVSHYE